MIRSNKIKSVSIVALLCIMLITTALIPNTTTPALAAKKPRTPTPTATATRTPTPPPTPTPPVSGNWSPTSSMSTARAVHTATRLADGRVLVAGGDRGAPFYDATASAERYDPASGTWAPTGSMATARESHTATVLADGRVLAAGGEDGQFTIFTSAEIYNPVNGTWAPTGSMTHVRSGHTATLLNDGRVLVAGGSDGLPLASAEIYNPATGTWVPTGSMSIARAGHTATLLSDGRVLVAGGQANSSSSSIQASAEIYDPASGTWAATGSMVVARAGHTATRLNDGRVLVVGGLTGDPAGNIALLASAELYNPATSTWTLTGSMITARHRHTMTLLSDGRVLIAGGSSGGAIASAEIYTPASGTWASTGSLTTARELHTATLLADGRVLAPGGIGNGTLASAELFTP